jgi:uncharacterized membrane protein YjjP (DUF1212 family)
LISIPLLLSRLVNSGPKGQLVPMAATIRDRESLEPIAILALEFGRLLMEVGSSARHVDEVTTQVAVGLGAERVELQVGYASLVVTIGAGSDGVTQMCRVGLLSVNETLHRALSNAAARIGQGGFTLTEARAELTHLRQISPGRPDWFVAVAVGVACAAFGRLLGVDWVAVGPIFLAAELGQMVRRQLALHKVNAFISAAVVALLGAGLCGLGARWAGSRTLATDMIAPVLLLVPGVPAFNAQYDILEGYPSLGSARAVWVVVMLIFMTAGVWLAQSVLGEGR